MSEHRRLRPRAFMPRASLMVAAALLGIGLSTAPKAKAANLYWDATGAVVTGGTGNWDTTSAFWSTTSAGTDASAIGSFTSSDIAYFTGTAGTATLTDPITIGGLVFNGADFTVAGNTLTLGASSGSPSISVSNGNVATVSSILAGTSGLTISGGGVLLLTNANNSYTGVTTISNGALVISSATALGADTSAISITSAGLTPGNTSTYGYGSGTLVLDGRASALTFGRNVNFEGRGLFGDRSSAILGMGDVTLSGTLTSIVSPLSAVSATYRSSRINSVNGTLLLSGTLSIGGTALAAGTTGATTGSVTTLGGVNQGGVSNFNLTGTLSGSSILEKSGDGTLFLNPSSTSGFSGALRISTSATGQQSSVRVTQLQVGSTSVFGTNSTASQDAASIDMNGGILEFRYDGSLNFGSLSAGKNAYMRASSTIITGPAAGGAAVNGLTTLGTFRMASGTTGTFASRNGFAMTMGAPSMESVTGDTSLTNNMGGTLTLTGDAWTNNDTTARTLTINGTGNTSVTGSIIASGALHAFTKSGAGLLTVLGTASTYTGLTSVTAGALQITDFRSLGTTASILLGNLTTGTGNLIIGTTGTPTALGLTTSLAISLSITSASNSIYASQSGTNPVILNGAITKIAAATTGNLVLGGTSTVDNIINVVIPVETTPSTGGVTKVGAGTWVLNAANTYLGATTIQAGTLKLRATAGASDVIKAGAVTFSNDSVTQTAGGTLEFKGFLNTVTTETVGVLTPTAGATNIVTVADGASTTLTFASLGTRGTAATVNYDPGATSTIAFTTAPTATNGIIAAASGGAAFQTYNEVDWAALSGSNVAQYTGYTTTGIPASGTTGAAVNYSQSVTATTTGTASINTLKVVGAAGASAPTITLGGILTLTAKGVLFDNSSGTATITGSQLGAASVETVIITAGSTAANALTVSSLIGSGTGSLTKAGSGTLIVGGNNTFTGNVTINEGTVRLSGATATLGVNSTAANITTLRQGTTLDINAAGASQTIGVGALQGAGTVTNSGGGSTTAGTISFGTSTSSGTTIFSGILQNGSGVLNVTFDGTTSRTQALLGQSTYTGVTTIATGAQVTVNTLANGGAASGIGQSTSAAANLVFNGSAPTLIYQGNNLVGSLNLGSNSATTDRLFTIAGAAAVISSTASNSNAIVWSNTGAIAYSGAASAKTLTLTGSSTGDNTFAPQITDSGTGANITSLTKTSTGQWNLAGTSNSYTGATTVNDGILGLNAAGALPSGSPLALTPTSASSVATLQMSGEFTRSLAVSATAGSGTLTFGFSIASTTGGVGFAAHSTPLVVAIGGTGSPTALTWGSGGFVGTGGVQNLAFGSTSALSSVDFRNAIDLGSAVRTINVLDNANTGADFATMSGALSGTGGGLLKIGSGILRLTGLNSYTGTTSVEGGTLVVSSLGGSTGNATTSVGAGNVTMSDTNAIVLGNATSSAGILQYVGPGETSDRKIRLRGTTAGNQIHADGTGSLVLTNVAHDTAETGNKTLSLRGSSAFTNFITSKLSNNVAGVLSVTVDGGTAWVLNNSTNDYTGGTTASGGALGIGHDSALGTGSLTVNNGNVFASVGDRTIANALNLTTNASNGWIGDYSLTFNGTNTLTGTGTSSLTVTTVNSVPAGKRLTFAGMTSAAGANRAWTIDGSGETVINGNFTTTSAFWVRIDKNGDGTLVLGTSGVNSTWNTVGSSVTAVDVDRGTLRFTASEAIPSAAGSGGLIISPELATADTATVDLNGTTQTINAFTASSDGTVRIDNTSSTAASFRFGANNSTVTFATGSGNYAIQNTGTGKLDIVKLGNSTVSLGAGVTMGNKGVIASEGGTFTIAGQVSAATGLRATGNSTLSLTGGMTNQGLITSVEVGGGSTLSLLNGAGSTMNLTSLNLGAGTGTATLNLNVGESSTDTLNLLTGGTKTLANTVTINMTDAGLAPSTTYTLLSLMDGGLTAFGTSNVIKGSTPGGFTSMTWNVTDTAVTLTTGTLIIGDLYWRGTTDTTWSAALNNWSEDKAGSITPVSLPGAGTNVVFAWDGVGTTALTTTLEQNFKINKLVFASGTTTPASVTINPGTVATSRLEIAPQTSTDGIEMQSAGPATVTINSTLRLGAAQTWNVASSAGALTVGGALLGEAGVTKSGAGKVTLSAAADSGFNALHGVAFTVSGGTLELTNASALGTTALGNLASLVLSGGAYYYNNGTAATLAHPITLSGGTLSAGGNTHTYSGNITVQASTSSSINLRDLNSATTSTTSRNTTLSGVLSGTGAITLDSVDTVSSGNQLTGNLVINNASSTWSGALNLTRGSTYFQNVAGTGTATAYVGFAGDINFNQYGRVVFRNVDSATLTRAGAITFAASALGELNVENRGTGSSNYTLTQSGAVNLNAGSIARFAMATTASNLVLTGGVVLNGTASFSVNGGDADSLVTISGTGISGTGTLNINDEAGAWTTTSTRLAINAAGTYVGNTTLTEGTLILGHKDALSSGSLTILGTSTIQASVDLSAAVSGPVPNAIILSANPTISGSNNLTFSGLVTNSGGSRTITNSLTSGTLSLGDIALSEASGTGRTLTIAGTANTTVTGVISNFSGGVGTASGLTYSGTGVLTLSGTNTYTGTTTLSAAAGRIIMQSSQALGTSAAPLSITTNASAPVLQIQSNSTAYNTTLTGTSSASIIVDALSSQASASYTLGTLTMPAATLLVSKGDNLTGTAGNTAQLTFGTVSLATATPTFNVGANTTLILANFIGTSVAVTKSGTGTLVMNTATTIRNTSSTVSAGTLQLGAGNAWSTAAQTMTMSGGAAVTLLLAPINDTGATFNGTNLVITTANTAPTIVTTRGLAAGAGITNTIGTISVGANSTNLTVIGGGTYDTVASGVNTVTSGTAQLTTGNITLTGSTTFTITNSTSGGVTLLNNAGTLIGGAYVLTLSGNGNFTQAGVISGATAGGGIVLGSGFTGVATFTGVSTATGGVTIKGGTAVAGVSNATTVSGAFGASSNTVTLGDTSGSVAANLLANSFTVSNPVNVIAGSSGVLTVGNNGTTTAAIFSGAVTLANNLNILNTGTSGTTTVSGGITGTGNLTLKANSTTGTGITLSTTAVDNIGTITNSGTGAATVSITGGIGANVTGITQSSATSALTVATTALTVNVASTTLTNSSTALLTVSGGISGTGNLILKNDGATASGVTLSTTSVNNTGTITNSGAGAGSVLISAVLGTNVAGVVQNSATSALTLSGANTFTGGVSVLAGSVVANVSNATTVSGAFGPSATAVTLGASSGSSNASVLANSFTVSNPINVVTGSSGVLTIGNNGTTTAAVFSGNITLGNNLTVATTGTTGTTTLSGGITGPGTITNAGSGSGATTLSGIIGADVTGVIQNSATSGLTLGAVANLWTSGLTIKAGTVTGGNNDNTFGDNSNVITLGDTTGSAAATLTMVAVNPRVFAQPITVAAGSSGLLAITSAYATSGTVGFTGAVTLNNDVTLSKTGASTGDMTFSGAFATAQGTGNDITIKNNGSPASGGLIVLSGTSVNNVGAIINSGTGTGGVTISANIGSNVTGITQNSATSALSVSGTNTDFTGTTTLNAGVLVFTSGALGASGAITFTGASTLRWSGHTDDLSSRLVLTSGIAGTIDTNGNNVVFNTAVATTGGTAAVLRKAGTGSLTLNVAAAHTGGTELNAGTLNLGTLDALGSGTFTISGTSTFDNMSGSAGTLSGNPVQAWNGDFTFTGTNDLNLGTGAVTLSASRAVTVTANTLTVGGAIGGTSFGLTKSGAGTLVLGAANTYSGATTIANGTLRMGASGSLNSLTAVTLANANNAATFDFNGISQTIASLTIGGASGGTATQGIVTLGAGTLTLGGNVTFTSTGNATATQQINGGTLDLGGATRTFTIGNSTGATNDMEITSVIQNGAFTKAGLGTLVLSGDNTFTGTVTLGTGAGNLVITKSGGLGVGPKTISLIDTTAVNSASIQLDGSGGNITLASNISWTTSSTNGVGGIVNLAGDNTINGNFTLTSGGGSTQFTVNGGSLVLAGTLAPNTTARFVVLNGTNNGTVSGVMQDGSPTNYLGVQKLGTGTWTITGANTYIGNTQIQAGALRVAGADNRILSTAAGANFSVILGTGTASGKLILGGDFAGGTGAGTQRNQTLTQNSSTNVLTTSGTGVTNAVVGGADGGTSAGTPASNSVLTLNIGAGYTNTYAGLIGWDGLGSVGFQNNINLTKSGGGTLVLSADLTNWTGTGTGGNLTADATRPELTLSGGILRLTSTAKINTVIRNIGGIIDDQGFTQGANFFLVTTGGLLTFNSATDTFAASGITSSSSGVVALNFNNTTLSDFNGSTMFLGAVGARVFSGATLSAGAGNTYRFGGGAAWNAVGASTVGGSGGNLRVTATNVVTGANNVIIGDNGGYNGATGLFGSNSSVEFTAAQNYTGTTTLAGGSLIVSNTNQLGSPATAAGSIILDGGIFRYSGITTDISNRLTIDSGATIDTNGQNVTFASAFGNSDTGTSDATSHPMTNGVGGLTKIGAGTLTLTAVNTYAGTTTVNGGTLQLNRQTGSLASTSGLTFAGPGTFNFSNVGATGTLSQTLGALTFSAGDGIVLSTRTAAQSTNLTFDSLSTRTAGATGNITVTGTGATTAINKVIFTTAPTAAQFINPGLYVAGTSFAAYDATGYVRAFAYGTDKDSTGTYTSFTTGASTTGLGSSASNADTEMTGAITNQGTQTISSLKITGAFALTQTASTTLTISSGGLIKTGATATISGGTLSTAGAEFVVRVDGTDLLAVSSNISASGGLTKSGTGTLTLSTGTNSFGNKPITINGGTLSVDSESRFGTAGTDYSSVLLNGGNLTITGNSTVNGPFALGLGGGTITHNYGSGDNSIGVAGVDLLLPGSGSRTLTLAGVADRQKIFRFNIGDNGGPTNVNIFSSGDGHVITLTANNTYTGTTTITRGVLRLGSTGALPGGLGGTSLSTSNTGGGNLIFAATGTLPTNNRAVLELNATVGDFYRGLGTGFDQVSWSGHGGFSVNDATVRTVNLGGAAAPLTWASGGFVPAGSALQFGQSAANVGFSGTIDFKNPIALGGAARTIDVANGSLLQDAILSGDITVTTGGALTKQGTGALRLNGINNTGAFTVNVNGGALYFEDASAVLGASATITVTATSTVPASIGLGGSTNPLSFFNSRLAAASNGAFLLDVNSSDALDFSAGNVTNMRLTAFNPANAAVYFTGSIAPSASTYRFGGNFVSTGTNGVGNTLVLSRQNILTGSRSVDIVPGNLTLTQAQDYSGGTTINLSMTGGNTYVGVGSDATFGSGTVTINGGNTVGFGVVNGDHVIPNKIVASQTGTAAFVFADQASDGVSNNAAQGALTLTGTFDLTGRSAAAVLHVRTSHAGIFLGDISGSTFGLTLNNSTSGLFSILSTASNGGVTKGYSGTVTLADNSNLYIDANGSLGSTTSGVTLGNSNLALQPATGTVTLTGRVITVTSDKSPLFMVYGGGNLVSTSGINSSNTMTAARTLTKNGAGTLTLQGKNGTWDSTASWSNTIQIQGGKLVLDATAGTFTSASDRFLTDTFAFPLTFGAANGTLGGGGTLEMVQYSGNANALTQAFAGTLTINQGAHTLKITNNDATAAANLNLGSTFTRAALNGGTMNFVSSTSGGTNTFGTSNVGTNGIIGGWATFNGVDWATGSGTAITALGSYTTLPTSGSTATVNYSLATNATTTLTANQSINSLKLAPTGTSQILALGATTLTNTSGGIIFDNTNGATTISGTGQIGATGSEVIVHTAGSGSGKLTLSAVVKGSATVLTKSGPGTLVLSGSNTYTGSLFINAGTVEYSSATTTTNLGTPTAAANNIILNGGTLSYTGSTSNTLSYGITVNSQSTINVADANGILLFNPTSFGITGVASTNTTAISATTGILQKTGAGALTIQGGLANGNLSVQVTAGTVNLAKTGTLLAVGEGTNASGMPYAALIVNNGAAAKITGAGTDQIGNASSVVIQGTGFLDVNGSGSTSVTESFDGLAGSGIVKNTGASAFTLTLGANNSSGISAYTVGAAQAAMLAGDTNINARGLNHFAGTIQDNIALTKIGSGIQILSGANTYSGATTISAGTLKLGAANVLPSGSGKGDVTIVGTGAGAAVGGAANILAPGTLDMGGFSQAINGLNSTTGGFVTSNPSSDANTSSILTLGNNDATSAFNGVIMNGYRVGVNSSTASAASYVGTVGLTKTGNGALTLSGANTYTGATTLSAGTLRAGNNAAFGTGTLNLNAGSLTSDGATARAFTNAVSVGGDLALGATSTYNGALSFSGAVNLGSSAARTITANSALTFTGGVTSTDQNLTIGGAGDVTISTLGLNLGLGSLTKNGAGTLLLSTNNTFAGATINSGTIRIGSTGSLGAGTITVRIGGILDLNGLTVGNTIVMDAGATITGGTISATNAPTSGTVATALTGTDATLTKTDSGRLELTGANTYTGATSVTAGTIAVSDLGNGTDASPLGKSDPAVTSNLVIGGGATLEYTGTGSTSTARSFTIASTGVITAASGAGALTFNSSSKISLTGDNPTLTLYASNTGENRFESTLEGTTDIKNLIVDGTGKWVIGGAANRFRGSGTIDVRAGATLGFEQGSIGTTSGAAIQVGNNTVLVWSGANNTDDISSRLQIAAGAKAKLDTGSSVVVFNSAPQVGTGSSIALTGGTLKIAQAVTSPGLNFNETAGNLSVNGTVGNVTLSSGGTLGGIGSAKDVVAGAGSYLSPGNSPGTLNLDNLTMEGGSTYVWQVQDATLSSGYDKVAVSGKIDLSGASLSNKITFKIISLKGASLGGDGTALGNPDHFLNPYDDAARPLTFTIATYGTLDLGGQNISDIFAFDFSSFKYSDGTTVDNASLWSMSYGSGSITVTAVPEPSTYGFGLGALALAGAAIRRRRKNQAKNEQESAD